jgi:hypothetical protein
MNHPAAPRINKIDNPKEYIGELVNTNLSPTLKARLISVGKETSYFEVVETDYETIKRNNTAVGQKFDVPTRIVYSMDFICKNI